MGLFLSDYASSPIHHYKRFNLISLMIVGALHHEVVHFSNWINFPAMPLFGGITALLYQFGFSHLHRSGVQTGYLLALIHWIAFFTASQVFPKRFDGIPIVSLPFFIFILSYGTFLGWLRNIQIK